MVKWINRRNEENILTDKEKEHCALTIMRRMLEKYSAAHHVSFEEVFFQFTDSYVYRELFDYGTGVWSEGPDYLMDIFEEALSELKYNGTLL